MIKNINFFDKKLKNRTSPPLSRPMRDEKWCWKADFRRTSDVGTGYKAVLPGTWDGKVVQKADFRRTLSFPEKSGSSAI